MASVGGGRRVGVRTRSRAPIVEEIVPNSGWTEDSAAHYLIVDLPGFKKEEVQLQLEGSGRIVAHGERQVNENKRLHFELAFPPPMNSDVDNISGKFDGEILHVIIPKRIIQEKKESETDEKADENVAATSGQESKQEEQSAKDDMREESKQEEQSAKDDMREETKHEEHAEAEERRTEGIRDQHADESHRNKKANYIGSFPKELIRKWEQEPSTFIRSAVEVLSRNKKIVVTAVLAFSLGVLVSRRFQSSITATYTGESSFNLDP